MVTHTIETYGRAPHNRNIWSTATERHTIETYGRHAWPILLSVFQVSFNPLLLSSTGMLWRKKSDILALSLPRICKKTDFLATCPDFPYSELRPPLDALLPTNTIFRPTNTAAGLCFQTILDLAVIPSLK